MLNKTTSACRLNAHHDNDTRLAGFQHYFFGESVLKQSVGSGENVQFGSAAARQNVLAFLCIVFVSYFYNRWLLDDKIYFYFDDWNWLEYAQAWPWSKYLRLLPSMIYNDRPVGGAFIKIMHEAFALDHRAFSASFLALHALNCVLVYAIGSRYIPRVGALIAALLAATWLSSLTGLTWSAAVFDILGAFLCLTTIWLRQLSANRQGAIILDIFGALFFLLSIRTKEFALGNIALLFIVSITLEKQKLRDVVRQLLPYLVVFLVYLVRYGYLQTHKPLDSTNVYSLDFGPISILSNLWFYFSTLFYLNLFPVAWTIFLAAMLVLALAALSRRTALVALFGLIGFSAMLGPTLLIPKHRDELYIYAPHFFVALAVGAVYAGNHLGKLVSVVTTVAIIAMPLATGRYEDIVHYYQSLGASNQAQLESAKQALGEVKAGSKIFVAGATPVSNPFSYGPGSSLRVIYHDGAIKAVEGQTVDMLMPQFCATPEPKRFMEMHDLKAIDITATALSACR